MTAQPRPKKKAYRFIGCGEAKGSIHYVLMGDEDPTQGRPQALLTTWSVPFDTEALMTRNNDKPDLIGIGGFSWQGSKVEFWKNFELA